MYLLDELVQRTHIRVVEQAENANEKDNILFASLCLLFLLVDLD